MQIRTILYQYIKTLIKYVFLLNFTHELLMSFRILYKVNDNHYYSSIAKQADHWIWMQKIDFYCHRNCSFLF